MQDRNRKQKKESRKKAERRYTDGIEKEVCQKTADRRTEETEKEEHDGKSEEEKNRRKIEKTEGPSGRPDRIEDTENRIAHYSEGNWTAC